MGRRNGEHAAAQSSQHASGPEPLKTAGILIDFPFNVIAWMARPSVSLRTCRSGQRYILLLLCLTLVFVWGTYLARPSLEEMQTQCASRTINWPRVLRLPPSL